VFASTIVEPLDSRIARIAFPGPPLTTIDERFSNADAVAMPWAETRRLLEKAELFWITTVRADGRPHVTPLVAVWLDGAMHFCTGASPSGLSAAALPCRSAHPDDRGEICCLTVARRSSPAIRSRNWYPG
jgi:hypothetical protein